MIDRLHKSVHVPQPPEAAFRLFTDEMGRWWPLATHSVGLDTATSVVVEGHVGGRIVEAYGGGRTAVWGTVLEWDPPRLLRATWHPGSPAEESTEIEVRFTPVDGGTVVELVHTGWDNRPDGRAMRENYDSGWDHVFGLFAATGGGELIER